jgi:hypothetical protein
MPARPAADKRDRTGRGRPHGPGCDTDAPNRLAGGALTST